MTRTARHATIAAFTALVAVAAIIAADFSVTAQAQSDDATGRIVARLLEDGRVEFGWQPAGGVRVLPRQRYFPTDATVDRWLRSSPVEIDGAAIGRINARLRSDGRIEFGFTPTDGERIEPQARYFPASARVGRWLRSTEITIGPPATPNGYTAISANRGHTCAIRAGSGAIVCWGINNYGQTDAPPGRFRAVSAGDLYTCAIRESGEIACWGYNEFGQGDAPEGSYSAVSAGVFHTCAIRENDSAIVCWGSNSIQWQGAYAITTGQIDAPDGTFTSVNVGDGNACAIRDTGEIACWGANGEPYITGAGPKSIGRMEILETGKSAPPDGRYTAVSTGWGHTCAIRDTGEIACWGANGGYYYDDGGVTGELRISEDGRTDAPDGRFNAVSAGGSYTCAIRASDGAIECWGDNEFGQGDAPEGSYSAVSGGGWHTCAIRASDSAIVCWGDNDDYGLTNVPTD